MTPGNEFFLIFLATIVVVRGFLFLKPMPSPTIGGFRLHHYMYGLVILIVGLFTKLVSVLLLPNCGEIKRGHNQCSLADYIFVSKGITVVDFQVMQDVVSDHTPLLIEFQ